MTTPATVLQLLSGGAAQALVMTLKPRLLAETGAELHGTFGAVGLMQDKLLAGAPCDVLILTQALIEALAEARQVDPRTVRPLGVVMTGLAVKSGEPVPAVEDAASLKAALQAARGIYLPDPAKATAGIHFMKVLQMLGIADDVAPRLRPFPNGRDAMHALAATEGPGLIGCTQVTEILYVPGVQLAGRLGGTLALGTVYSAAVAARAAAPEVAWQFVQMMAGAQAAPLRVAVGFEA